MFEKICSFENLHLAYLKARECKRYRDEILKFSYNLEENLLNLQEELLNQTYQHGGYREFIVCDAKKRHIKAAPFRDRVVHHALCNIIGPIFDKGFIYDSYACRKEKGTHWAIKRLERFLKSASGSPKEIKISTGQAVGERALDERKIYCLECDVSKYFESINHEVLLGVIKRKIADKKVIWLIEEILGSPITSASPYHRLWRATGQVGGATGQASEEKPGTGIPIGNLTSQLFANIYLNELDQLVKHNLKIKYYIRYMDDFLFLNDNKKKLREIKKQTQEFLKNKLKLELHPKKANVFPINRGIDFLGYRNYGSYRLLRKSTVKRFIKRTKIYQEKLKNDLISEEKFNQSLQSWLAYAEFAHSWQLRKSLSKKLKVKLII